MSTKLPASHIRIKRAYEPPAHDDGARILIDRLWPRGVTKERARLDAWLKDLAPSPELRTWWNHDPERLDEFTVRYRAELDGNPATGRAVAELRGLAVKNAAANTRHDARLRRERPARQPRAHPGRVPFRNDVTDHRANENPDRTQNRGCRNHAARAR